MRSFSHDGGRMLGGQPPTFRAQAGAAPTNADEALGPLPGMLSMNIPGDCCDYLPPEAAAQLRAMILDHDDQHVVILNAIEQQQEARTVIQNIEAHLKRFMTARSDGGFGLTESAPQVTAERSKLKKLVDEQKQRGELLEIRSARSQALGRLIGSLKTWILSGRPGGTAIQMLPPINPVLRKNETIPQALERNQLRLRELTADIRRAETAPIPKSIAKRRVQDQLANIARNGRPSTMRLLAHGTKLEFPTKPERLEIISTATDQYSYATGELPDAIALLTWLFSEAIAEKIEHLIDQDADEGAALSDEARAELLAQLNADFLSTEREEVALVVAAQGTGAFVPFRPDCSPAAISG